jgi:hypothetical protein
MLLDGELARLKTRLLTQEDLDSVFDIILNFLFLSSICYVSKLFLDNINCFFLYSVTGTLNYYYVILRNRSVGGDKTVKFSDKTPKALAGESQKSVAVLHFIYDCVWRFR